MDFITEMIDAAQAALEEDEWLCENAKIMAAFPGRALPTLPQKSIVCIGISAIRLDNSEIGGDVKTAGVTLSVRVYTPFRRGSGERLTCCAKISGCLLQNGFAQSGQWTDEYADVTSSCYICTAGFEKNTKLQMGGNSDAADI